MKFDPEWRGETGCKHYRGVTKRQEKRCCGGRVIVKFRVTCAVHKVVYSDSACIRGSCRYYETEIRNGRPG